jgi:hypothetical protein
MSKQLSESGRSVGERITPKQCSEKPEHDDQAVII